MIRILLTTLALLVALPAAAEPTAATLFAGKETPSNQKSMPIGSYSRGCAAGLVELPETGPGWQAMRLSRNRNWGQPTLVAYIEDLAGYAQKAGWKGIYVGDMSQPRGGPMNSGHASHQIGLDVDIWALPAGRLDLSRKERENVSTISLRTADEMSINSNWNGHYAAFLEMAASDPRVDRIFVAAAIKKELCRTAKKSDKKWLQHIRPERGHDDHFHIRLKCPKGATLCDTQKPTVAELSKNGDGCDEALDWWFSDDYFHPKPPKNPQKPAPRKKGSREFTMADLPSQCADVLSSP